MGTKLSVLKLPEENSCGCLDRAGEGRGCLCPTTGLVQLIGRKHALPLLGLIGERGSPRFSEIRSEMGGMSSSTLAIRLSELEQAGLVNRRMFAEIPPRVEYSLSEEGKQLRKSLIALSGFARRK